MDANDLTVIVGDNDCGKTNVLRTLNLSFKNQTDSGQGFSYAVNYNRFAAPRSGSAPK
jgi:predicted ATP-dependent endonuclease of OLD family